MKKIIALLLSLIMLAGALASCSTLKEGEKGASISMYFASYPHTLDPAYVQLNSDVTEILGLIFESLTTIDEDGEVVGALAEEWEYVYDKIDDKHKMTFKLRDTAWSDGRPVSPDDVIYAWKRILAPETESPYASLLFPIENAKEVKSGIMTSDDLGIANIADDLLEITFEEEYDINMFAEIVSNIHLCPIREDIVTRALNDVESADESEENDGEDNEEQEDEEEPKGKDWAASAGTIVCNGPFRLQTLEEGNMMILERNSYFRRDPEEDALDKYVLPFHIVCKFQEDTIGYKDESDLNQIQYQTKQFKDENIFYTSGFTKDTFSEFSDDIETAKTLNSYVYYYNTANELLSDAKVRQALSVALDRSKIVSEITGTGEVAATGYVPHGVLDAEKKDDFRTVGGELNSKEGDIDKAKSLLKEANVNNGSFTLTYLIPESQFLKDKYSKKVVYTNVYEDIANYAKDVWEELGFSVELKGLYPDEYLKALYARDYDVLGINNIMDSSDAFGYLAPFSKYYSGSVVSIDFDKEAYTPHYTNLQDDEYDELIDSIVYVSDRTERAKLLHDAENMFNELSPATALYYYTTSYVASDELKNIETGFFGYKNLNDLKLKNYREINSREQAEKDK